MTSMDELAEEYYRQYQVLGAKIEGLRPLLCIYKGEDLLALRRKLKIYYEMANECFHISEILAHYYDEEETQEVRR